MTHIRRPWSTYMPPSGGHLIDFRSTYIAAYTAGTMVNVHPPSGGGHLPLKG